MVSGGKVDPKGTRHSQCASSIKEDNSMNLIENFSFYSYLTATAAYFLLLLLTLVRIKKIPFALPFLIAVFCSLVWSGYTVISIQDDQLFISDTLSFETVRNVSWFIFLTILILNQRVNANYLMFAKSRPVYAILFLIVFIFIHETSADFRYQVNAVLDMDPRLLAHVVFAIIGLILIEQLYRNATQDQRWTVKFLCLGLGSLFTIDFFIYSKSLLFARLDASLWDARGMLNAMVIPLLAVSTSRLSRNVSPITAPRKVVFHTTVLFGTGIYLILMAQAGFYIRDYGSSWGELAQIVFIFLAVLLLLILFVSGKTRALAKIYFNKHFFHYRYDYRDEWIKMSKSIARLTSIEEFSGFVIHTMSNLVESSGGGLWLKNQQGDFYLAENRNLGFEPQQQLAGDDSLIQFLINKQWVIDFVEFDNDPEMYDQVDLSQWYAEEKNVWLIIPLFHQNEMMAFVVLTQARVPRQLNWEDHDLLKTVGMQLTNALALNRASDELSRSRQFEAYNRLSAYIVHDLKNLVAQISLIVKNAEKHKHNPEFIDDSIETLENVVNKMQHLVGQFRKGPITPSQETIINLSEVMEDVALQQAGNKPALEILTDVHDCRIFGEREKMTAILGHLVQNAQEATDDEGHVKMHLSSDERHAIVQVIDNGIGMDKKFIAERLFKPFDTTKGNAGMGIGVYEARDYILKYFGQILVDSTPGKGTTFTIKLPLANSKADAEEHA